MFPTNSFNLFRRKLRVLNCLWRIQKSKSLYRRPRLQIIFAVTLMGVIAVSIISPVLPKVRGHFGVTQTEVGLLITAFTLPGIFLSFFISVLTDRTTRGTDSLLISIRRCRWITHHISKLHDPCDPPILSRSEGAGLVMIATTLIGDYYDGVGRSGAMRANASVLSVGTASYPFIGGAQGRVSWSSSWSLPRLLIRSLGE